MAGMGARTTYQVVDLVGRRGMTLVGRGAAASGTPLTVAGFLEAGKLVDPRAGLALRVSGSVLHGVDAGEVAITGRLATGAGRDGAGAAALGATEVHRLSSPRVTPGLRR